MSLLYYFIKKKKARGVWVGGWLIGDVPKTNKSKTKTEKPNRVCSCVRVCTVLVLSLGRYCRQMEFISLIS